MKKTDPLYKLAAIIASLAVLIAAFSAIFIHGGEIELPGGKETATLSRGANERGEDVRGANERGEDTGEAPRGGGDNESERRAGEGGPAPRPASRAEDDEGNSPGPSPTATASPSPTPSSGADAGLNEEVTGEFDELRELSEMESTSVPSSAPDVAPSGVGATFPDVMDFFWEISRGKTAGDFTGVGMVYTEDHKGWTDLYTITKEFGNHAWRYSAELFADLEFCIFSIEYESSGDHAACAQAFSEGYAYLTDSHGPHNSLSFISDDINAKRTEDEVVSQILQGGSDKVLAGWIVERGGWYWSVMLDVSYWEDGGFSIALEME